MRDELEIESATYWPHIPLTIAALLPYSSGLLNRGSWGPKPSVWSWFSLLHLISNWNCYSNSNWLNPSVVPGYIIVWRPPASCGRMHLHRIQPHPQVKVIFRYLQPDAPVSIVPLPIYTGASLNWWLGRRSIGYNYFLKKYKLEFCIPKEFYTSFLFNNLLRLSEENTIDSTNSGGSQWFFSFFQWVFLPPFWIFLWLPSHAYF